MNIPCKSFTDLESKSIMQDQKYFSPISADITDKIKSPQMRSCKDLAPAGNDITDEVKSSCDQSEQEAVSINLFSTPLTSRKLPQTSTK